jgi:hypothetical protein
MSVVKARFESKNGLDVREIRRKLDAANADHISANRHRRSSRRAADTSGENQTLQSPRKGARILADNGFRGSIC